MSFIFFPASPRSQTKSAITRKTWGCMEMARAVDQMEEIKAVVLSLIPPSGLVAEKTCETTNIQ